MELKFTKFGVSAALLSMICYFLGYYNLIAVVGMMVFVLVLADSDDLKKNAIQAVLFSLFVSVISTILVALSNSYSSCLSTIFSFINTSDAYEVKNVLMKLDIANFLSKLLNILEFVALLIFVFGSIKGKTVKIPFVTKMLDKHFKGKEESATATE